MLFRSTSAHERRPSRLGRAGREIVNNREQRNSARREWKGEWTSGQGPGAPELGKQVALVPYISGMRHPSPHARRVALVPVQLSRSVGYIAHSQGIYLMLQSDGV